MAYTTISSDILTDTTLSSGTYLVSGDVNVINCTLTLVGNTYLKYYDGSSITVSGSSALIQTSGTSFSSKVYMCPMHDDTHGDIIILSENQIG